MTRGGAVSTVFRLGRLAAAALVVSLLLVLTGCSLGSQPTAERQCANAVLADWSDGRIDRTYSSTCYLAALAALPEDLRAYTSASDDITRALQSSTRTRASASRPSSAAHPIERSSAVAAADPPTGLLGLAAFAGAVVVAGVAGFAIRRLRHPRS